MVINFHAFDNYGINVDFHILANLIFEHLIHHALISNSNINEAEGHDSIGVYSSMSNKGYLQNVFGQHSNLVVFKKCVKKIEHYVSRCGIYRLIFT